MNNFQIFLTNLRSEAKEDITKYLLIPFIVLFFIVAIPLVVLEFHVWMYAISITFMVALFIGVSMIIYNYIHKVYNKELLPTKEE